MAAMEEARAEANAIIKQHEDALRSVFEQHQIEARRQSETRVRAESVTAKQQLNMAMSKAQLELKREMGKIQTELKTELFEEVQLKLLAFMRTEEYKEVLIRYIEKAAQFASGMAMTIYINPSDADKKTYLEERTGMTLTISKVDFIGGVRAVVPEKNVLVDYAFKGALENESCLYGKYIIMFQKFFLIFRKYALHCPVHICPSVILCHLDGCAFRQRKYKRDKQNKCQCQIYRYLSSYIPCRHLLLFGAHHT